MIMSIVPSPPSRRCRGMRDVLRRGSPIDSKSQPTVDGLPVNIVVSGHEISWAVCWGFGLPRREGFHAAEKAEFIACPYPPAALSISSRPRDFQPEGAYTVTRTGRVRIGVPQAAAAYRRGTTPDWCSSKECMRKEGRVVDESGRGFSRPLRISCRLTPTTP